MRVETIGKATLYHADNRDALALVGEVDGICTDPPYGLSREPDPAEVLTHWLAGDDYTHKGSGFMGKSWDSFVPGPATWRAAIGALKPGGHLLSFSGTRTYDLATIAIRLAGFEIRDEIAWLYGSGFPKSQNVAKFIDQEQGLAGSYGEPKSEAHAGWIKRGAMRGDSGHEGYQRPWMQDEEAVENAARRYIPESPEAQQWEGWGTALKPAHEPIVVARKPMAEKTIAGNVVAHGAGGLNVDACRIEGEAVKTFTRAAGDRNREQYRTGSTIGPAIASEIGRFPANVVHDGSDEVVALFPIQKSGSWNGTRPGEKTNSVYGKFGAIQETPRASSEGSAARFFYCSKAGADDREFGDHPTVKPVDLMRWLVRLIVPKGGVVLDPFMGSGSTGVAAIREDVRFIGIEQDQKSFDTACRRLSEAQRQGRLEL